MIELLAPAGDEKCFFVAVNNGANAIYLGLDDFSARKNAQNFSAENISYYVSYAHALGVKVYLAVNTLIKDSEIDKFLQTVSVGVSAGVDAFILQDVFLGKILKENFPQITLHLSTQAGINNVDGALFAKEYGFERVILARETSIKEIEKITKVIETETFAHGALCTCFSGHCYMSAYVGGNSGNRGFCKQPCRKIYKLESKKGGDYPISLADLNLSNEIDKLISIGVKSIKIEGRMRSPEYVASAVSLYRNAINGKKCDLTYVKRTFNRGNYTKGYLYGVDKNIISDKVQNHIGEKVGTVKTVKADCLTVTPKRNNLKGDAFKIISNGIEVGNAVAIENGEVLRFKGNVKVGYDVNITKDVSLTEKLLCDTKKRKLKVTCRAVEGEKLYLSCEGVELYSNEVIESASTYKTTEEEILKNLLKTDKYPFEIEADITVSQNPFIVKSILNKMRSALYEKVFTKDIKPLKNTYNIEKNETFYNLNYDTVILSDKCVRLKSNSAFVLRPKDYANHNEIIEGLKTTGCDNYLFIPAFLDENDKAEVVKLLPYFDGVYADGLCGIRISKQFDKKLIVGLGVNVFNSHTVNEVKRVTDDIVLSQELSFSEINALKKDSGYTFTLGSIRLMELLYCPFGKNCKECKRDKDYYLLTDEMGRKFKIFKYKLNGKCRFEVYNEQILFTQNKARNFYNFIGLTQNEIDLLLSKSKEEVKRQFVSTVGNSKRGVF
ncbi:MAG: U32 family peptidase [Clostridiales bacterium]|nr:U32 family peptidase [Clostridiales bacterium]